MDLESGFLALITEHTTLRADVAVLQGSNPASAVESAMVAYAGMIREAGLPVDHGAEERLRRALRRRFQMD